MTDRREPRPTEDPSRHDRASDADDRPEDGAAPRHRTLYRILGATASLALLVVAALLSALLIGLNLYGCTLGATGGVCSDRTQNAAQAFYFGGVVAGLVGIVVAFVNARRASPRRWGSILALAVAIPLVCLFVAVDLTVD